MCALKSHAGAAHEHPELGWGAQNQLQLVSLSSRHTGVLHLQQGQMA